tara:strand:- start:124 stop:363 length:240 start_codon:yes stop_codon:yes gene_type:complete
MDNLVVLSISAAVVYFFVKFIEMRFIKRESEPLKGLIKDSVFVAGATGLGGFIVSQMGSLTADTQVGGSPNVFTDDPGF